MINFKQKMRQLADKHSRFFLKHYQRLSEHCQRLLTQLKSYIPILKNKCQTSIQYLSALRLPQSDPNIDKPPIRSVVYFGGIVLGIFLVVFVGWATLAPLESAAIAPGKITVDTNRKTIQHLEGGIIKTLHVREGAQVKMGELLVSLNDTRAQASVDMVRNRAATLSAEEARLIAEQNGDDKITFSSYLIDKKDNPKIAKIIKSQHAVFNTKKTALNDQLEILGQRIGQLNKQVDSLQAQADSSDTQLKLIEEEIVAVKYLEERKLIEKPRLLALQREAARLIGNRGENLGKIAQSHQRIGETKTQIISLKSNDQKEIAEQLRTVQRDLEEALEREKAAVDVLERTKMYAPKAGTVVDLKFHTQGAVITPGTPIMDIVPSQDTLVITARVNPLDIDVVHPGLVARVQLSAYKQRHLPKLVGTVKRVSADSFSDPNTGEIYYEARVEIKPSEIKALPKNVRLYPGMPAQVMIITDNRTAWDYFFTPIRDSFDQAFREQ